MHMHMRMSMFLQVLGLGITNQRETTLVWSRSTGKPLYNAIVWLDNRTRWVIGAAAGAAGATAAAQGSAQVEATS